VACAPGVLGGGHHCTRRATGNRLASLAWADEIVVVDAESIDRTVEVARGFTDRIVVRPWLGFAAQNSRHRQTGVDFFGGRDEEVSGELRAEILGVLADGPGWPPAPSAPQHLLGPRSVTGSPRLADPAFRRGQGASWSARYESVEVDGEVGRLRGPLIHRSYDSVAQFLERANRYSSLAADDLVRGGARSGPVALVLRPLGRFVAMYLLRGGFLDGAPGLLLAGLYAYYVFIRSAKVWEKTRV
jgi:hypothetical protein